MRARIFPATCRAVLLLTLTLTLALAIAIPGRASASASDFVKNLGEEAIEIASQKSIDGKAREDEFRRLMRRGFAVNGIARFVLGRYWRVASEAQQARYLELFENYLVTTYARRFRNYAGETFLITGERNDGRKGVTVMMDITYKGGPAIKVKWRVKKSKSTGEMKIVDMVIENVSMSITQRSDFATAIANHGGKLDPFLDDLERKSMQAE